MAECNSVPARTELMPSEKTLERSRNAQTLVRFGTRNKSSIGDTTTTKRIAARDSISQSEVRNHSERILLEEDDWRRWWNSLLILSQIWRGWLNGMVEVVKYFQWWGWQSKVGNEGQIREQTLISSRPEPWMRIKLALVTIHCLPKTPQNHFRKNREEKGKQCKEQLTPGLFEMGVRQVIRFSRGRVISIAQGM